MARKVQLDVIETAKGDALKKAALDAELAAKALDGMGDQASQAERRLDKLDRELVKHRALVAALGKAYVDSGDAGALAALKSERAQVLSLQRIRKEMTATRSEMAKVEQVAKSGLFGGALDKISAGATSGVFGLSGGLTQALVAGAVVAAPGIAATIGAAVGLGVSGGALAAGILLAAKDSKVRDAWGQFAAEAKTSLQDVAVESFQQPLIRTATIFRDSVRADLPLIKSTFDAVAKDLEPLAQGAAGGVAGALPGIAQAAKNAQPVVSEFSHDMRVLGKSTGDALATITSESPGAVQALRDLTNGLSALEAQTAGSIAGLSLYYEAQRRLDDELLRFAGLPANVAKTLLDNSALIGTIGQLAAQAAALVVKAAQDEANAFVSVQDKILLQQQAMQGADAQAATLNKDLLAIKDSAERYGTTLDQNTAAGQANHGTFQTAISDAEALREKMIASGQSAAYANDVYNQTIAKIYATGQAAGYTKQQLDAMVGKYVITIETVSIYRSVYLDSPSGRPGASNTVRYFERSGGVVHAAQGLLADGGVANRPTISFAEKGLREAFIPDKGISRERGLGLATVAADWYGADVVPRGNPYAGGWSARRRSASPSMAAPSIDPDMLGRAVARALHGMSVTLDGWAVGRVLGQQALMYSWGEG